MRSFVIGNVAFDETFAVPAMPEAGLSILARAATRDLGGKGANQAIAMGRAGLSTRLVAATGRDPRADEIRRALGGEPVEARLVVCAEASDASIIFTMPDGENAVVTTTESADALTPADACHALDDSGPGDVLVMQGNLSAGTTKRALLEGKRRGLVTIFNPSPLRPYFPSLWPLVDVVVLNLGEAKCSPARRPPRAPVGFAKPASGRRFSRSAARAPCSSTLRERRPFRPAQRTRSTRRGPETSSSALWSPPPRCAAAPSTRARRHGAAAAAIAVSRKGTRSSFPTRDELAAILIR
jgi:ribokinase